MTGSCLVARVLGWAATLGLQCALLVVDGALAAQSPSPQQPEASPTAPASAARELPRVRTASMGVRERGKEVLISIEPDGAILHGGTVKAPASSTEPRAIKEAYLAILVAARQAKGRTIESRPMDGGTIDIVVDPVRLQAAPDTPWVRVLPLLEACCQPEVGFIHVDFAVATPGPTPSAGQGDEGTLRYTIPVGHEAVPVVVPPPPGVQPKGATPLLEGVELVLTRKQATAGPADEKPARAPAGAAATGFVPQWTIRLAPDPLTEPELRRSLVGSALGRLPVTLDTLDEALRQLEILGKDPKATVTWNDMGPRLLPVTIQPAADAPLELVLQSREAVFAAGFKIAHFGRGAP